MTRHEDDQAPQRRLRRLQLPEPLVLPRPHRLPDPHGLVEPRRPPGPLELPGPLPAPEALELPERLRVVLDRDPAPARGPSAGVIPQRTRTARTSLPVSKSNPPVPLKALPPLTPSKPGASTRTFRIPTPAWLLAAAAIGIAVLSGGHHSPTTPVGPAPLLQAPGPASPAASPPQSVGMPIPTGNAPVQPIRIVLDVSAHPIPGDERRALGVWIEQTQNIATRIRTENRGRLSLPLAGGQWTVSPATATTPEDALTWLDRGVREHRAGLLVRVGASGVSRVLKSDIRESTVSASSSVLRIHNTLASEIAREIMITSQQGYGGTTAP